MPLAPKLTGANLALVAVFAALIAALTLPPEFDLASGVPLTLQTLGVVTAGLVLGAWRGFAAVSLYLIGGIVGLPIFADGASGWGVMTGPTGGYLWAFPVAAFVVGWLAERLAIRGPFTYADALAAGLASIPVVYAVGVPWLAHVLGVPVIYASEDGGGTAVAYGLTPFIVGDLIKVAIAAAVAVAVHRAFPQVLGVKATAPSAEPAKAI